MQLVGEHDDYHKVDKGARSHVEDGGSEEI